MPVCECFVLFCLLNVGIIRTEIDRIIKPLPFPFFISRTIGPSPLPSHSGVTNYPADGCHVHSSSQDVHYRRWPNPARQEESRFMAKEPVRGTPTMSVVSAPSDIPRFSGI